MPDIPHTPQSERPEDLGFTRQTMVGWFDPSQLARTGIKAVLSGLFGAYADKREMQAALHATDKPSEYTAESTMWIDYLADTGDGWNSTYTMARLLAAENVTVTHGDTPLVLPRGRILVLGGDQVYPTAKRGEYKNRFVGPFTAALPGVLKGEPPDMFALPGNHDWYDGLTSFLRLFCQGRWVGGWRTRQSRSYFAALLPHRWWLWGIDTQFESDIDKPQLDYFNLVAATHVRPGDRIILCTGSPTWVETNQARAEGYRNLRIFERKVIDKADAHLALILTGDLHAYCRYDSVGTRRKTLIIAGGGGAYLYGTHQLPAELTLDEGVDDDDAASTNGAASRVTYARRTIYPSAGESRRLRVGVLRFPFMATKFSLFLAAWYLIFAWLIQSTSKWLARENQPNTLLETLASLPITDVWLAVTEYVRVFAHAPPAVGFSLLLVVGLTAFAGDEKWWHRVVGALHGTGHIVLSGGLIWLFAWANLRWLCFESFDTPLQVLVFSAEMFVVGGLLGGFLMGVYLFLADVLAGMHTNEVFSAQHIEHYKNFLRLRIGADGVVTVFPLGVRRVGRRWRLNPNARNGEPWFDAVGAAPAPHLIEDPIVIPGSDATASARGQK
jgi:hypothetical protein